MDAANTKNFSLIIYLLSKITIAVLHFADKMSHI